MDVETRLIADLAGYSNNPRIITDEAIDKVADSISRFGFRQPIVVDEHNTVVAGHTRLQAARRLGLEEVPVHVAADLTAVDAAAYRLADNQSAEFSVWDTRLLAEELSRLDEEGPELAAQIRPDFDDIDDSNFDPEFFLEFSASAATDKPSSNKPATMTSIWLGNRRLAVDRGDVEATLNKWVREGHKTRKQVMARLEQALGMPCPS